MVRLIYTLRVIWTQAQREKVNKLTIELKNIQTSLEIYKKKNCTSTKPYNQVP